MKSLPKRTVFLINSLILAVILGSAGCLGVSSDSENISEQFTLHLVSSDPENISRQFTLQYDAFEMQAKHIDQVYRIQVALPMNYALDMDTRFPVIYVTDADMVFGTASEIGFLAEQDSLAPNIAPAIIVGIGYDDPAMLGFNRTRDFTPEDVLDDWFIDYQEQSLGIPVVTGGADAFLDFIENELHPEIRSRYRVEGDTAALMSNSMGGVFGYYAFLKNSALFDRYWIGSPAIFGRGTYLVEQLPERLEAGFDRPTHIYMSLGEYERTRTANGLQGDMFQQAAGSYTTINEQLSKIKDPNFSYESKEFEGETHNSVVPAAMSRAYRFLMRMQEN